MEKSGKIIVEKEWSPCHLLHAAKTLITEENEHISGVICFCCLCLSSMEQRGKHYDIGISTLINFILIINSLLLETVFRIPVL